jgi:hypothetical protein
MPLLLYYNSLKFFLSTIYFLFAKGKKNETRGIYTQMQKLQVEACAVLTRIVTNQIRRYKQIALELSMSCDNPFTKFS